LDRIPTMKTSDFYLKPSAKNINESMEKRFGEKLDLESYSIDQLNRASSLIESKIATYKTGDFNSTLESEEYHRLTFMKDAVVAELNERAVSKAQQRAAGAALAAKRGKGKAKGASKEMEKMSTKELEKFAGTKHKGLPEKKKKKVDESMQTMKELALHHAIEYSKHHKKGNLEHAMHHKKQCEECGGILTHDAMGECWMSHGGDKPARVMMSPISGNTGAASMMTAEAAKKKTKNNDGNLANNAKPYDKVTRGDVIAGRLGKDEMGGKNKKVSEAAKPDFLDMDKDGNKKETMKKAIADKKKKSVKESYEMAIRRYLREGEEAKAELVMAVKDMVDKFTAWSEDIASMQATAAMEMADQIRDELGADQAEAFKQAITPALDQAFQAVKGAREAMNSQVAAMTGGAPAMPAAPDMGAEAPAPDMGADAGAEEPMPDMGGEEPAPDMPPPEGREKRESIERHRRLARILAS
jgi:hypothetical protein